MQQSTNFELTAAGPDGDAWQPITLQAWRDWQVRETAALRAEAHTMIDAKFDEVAAQQLLDLARVERDLHPETH
jgi:Fe-S cluster biosynthesis and repair protein YggX